MPYIDTSGEKKGWSLEAQPGLGLVDYVETVPELLTIPQSLTAAQGGIALIRAGYMDLVLNAVNDPDTPAEVKWAFEKAQSWDRNSVAFNFLADKCGISEDDKDRLFREGAAIKV